MCMEPRSMYTFANLFCILAQTSLLVTAAVSVVICLLKLAPGQLLLHQEHVLMMQWLVTAGSWDNFKLARKVGRRRLVVFLELLWGLLTRGATFCTNAAKHGCGMSDLFIIQQNQHVLGDFPPQRMTIVAVHVSIAFRIIM